MKKLLGIIVLGLLLSGCVTTTEPLSEKNNPAKIDNTIKIIYSSPSEIIIMANSNQLALNVYKTYPYQKPNEKIIQTAFNHCKIYKKNSYHYYKKKNPLPYKLIANTHYRLSYNASLSDMYDWRSFTYKGKYYQGFRFSCSVNQGFFNRSKLTAYNESIWPGIMLQQYHRGESNFIVKKRVITQEEIAENKKKALEEKERIAKLEKQRRIVLIESLEKEYGDICSKSNDNDKFKKGTKEYGDCLIRTDQAAIAIAREKDELRKKKKIELDKKLAAMTPTERHAYNCSETFNFKKGSEKFNDCVFKLYTAELDIQKLELEKQVAEANAKATSNEQLRAESLAKAQIASANASTRAANLNSSMQLMKLSEQLIKGNQPKNPFNTSNVRLKTTCSNVGGFLSCF